MASAERERERDLDRFLTFVDAMVAIAATLLVLPLVDLVSELADGGSVSNLVQDHEARLGAFFLSFLVIARLWYAQHLAVRHLMAMNGRVFQALMLWSLTIVFLPFPTALVAQEGHQATTKLLYIGTTTLSMATLALLDWLLTRDPTLTDAEEKPELAHTLLNTGLLVIALLLSVGVPALSYFPMLLLALDAPLMRLGRHLSHRRKSRAH